MKPPVVTVFGSSRPEPGSTAYQTACELGRAIAQAGWTVCNGGYGGTMEAAAKGAVEAGGHTIGVTCEIFGRGGANPYIRQEIPTFDLMSRLTMLYKLGRAYVVLPGGTGTLLELALVWELTNKGLLRRKAPVVALGEFWASLTQVVRLDQPDTAALLVAHDVAEVIEMIRPGLTRTPHRGS